MLRILTTATPPDGVNDDTTCQCATLGLHYDQQCNIQRYFSNITLYSHFSCVIIGETTINMTLQVVIRIRTYV